MQEQLKPCPFCGGNPEKTKNKTHHLYAGKPLYTWQIRCLLCGASIVAPENAEAYAIDLWNGAIPHNERCEILEKEATWLADNLAERDCPHNCPSEEAPMLEECAFCWREAAKAAIADEAGAKEEEVKEE